MIASLSKFEQIFESNGRTLHRVNAECKQLWPSPRPHSKPTQNTQSDARVFLERPYTRFVWPWPVIFLVREPGVPVIAHALGLLQPRGRELLPSRFLPLQDLQSQTRRRVPGYVAMHQPDTRVVRFEGNDDVSTRWK